MQRDLGAEAFLGDRVRCFRGRAQDFPDTSLEPACVVTSPPYNAGVAYPNGYEDFIPWPIYRARAIQAAANWHRHLIDGGRVWVVLQPDVNARPRTPEEITKRKANGELGIGRVNLAGIWHDALARAGFHYRNVVVWIQDSFSGDCAWGSWLRPSAPNLRGDHEHILVYFKSETGEWKRQPPASWFEKWTDSETKASDSQLVKETIGEQTDWPEICRNVWRINTVNTGKQPNNPDGRGSSNPGFPARFPLELARRCIRLSTWPEEVVWDPYAGSGTTGQAATELGRRALLVDVGGITPMPPNSGVEP